METYQINQLSEIKSEVTNINPEPIGIFTLPTSKHLSYKEIIENIFNKASNNSRQVHPHEPLTEKVGNKLKQNVFNDFPELKELRVDMQKMFIKYINGIGFSCDDVIINSGWINRAKKGADLKYHYHTNSYVSGNYFVNFNPEVHTKLNFSNDRHQSRTPLSQQISLSLREKPTIWNSPFVGIEAKEGQIVIWRSHMVHGYHKLNQSDGRLTLSVNAMPTVFSDGEYEFAVSERKL
jgi:hypothetical protein